MATKPNPVSIKSTHPLPQRIHFRQFIFMHPELDEMQVAGFKAYCGKDWMYEKEWQDLYTKLYGDNNIIK